MPIFIDVCLYIYELFFLQLNFPTCEVFSISSCCNDYVFFEITRANFISGLFSVDTVFLTVSSFL